MSILGGGEGVARGGESWLGEAWIRPAGDSRIYPMKLDHHRLEVYQLARQLRREVLRLTAGLPRGHSDLVDQLNRAVLSIKLNIAEG